VASRIFCEITFTSKQQRSGQGEERLILKFVPSGVATVAELQSRALPISRSAEARSSAMLLLNPDKGEGHGRASRRADRVRDLTNVRPGRMLLYNWRARPEVIKIDTRAGDLARTARRPLPS